MSKRKYTQPLTLASLKLLNDSRKLWLSPDYQRGEVWTRSQKQLLIDSLLNNIDIPKVYLREKKRGTYEFEVVDGQQRLRAIFEFLEHGFPLEIDSDSVDGEDVAGRKFNELSIKTQIELTSKSLDVTHLVDYSDDDVEDMFLRLQNGTPLNAAEKRHAWAGDVRKVVTSLSHHRIFSLAGFSNKRFGFEDAAAKSLHLQLVGVDADLKPASIKRTYDSHPNLTARDQSVKSISRTWNFIVKGFKGKQSPRFKKYAVLTLTKVVIELLDDYDLASHPAEFSNAYLRFEANRAGNSELPEENRDQELSNYTEAARNDSVEAMTLRSRILKKAIVESIPQIRLLDSTRTFSDEQRFVIFRRDKGTCQLCREAVEEGNWHADHIVPHSKGGPTSIANGQLTHVECNLHKGANVGSAEA
ncbi:MAG: DUF262 domain-containing protein [Thermoplasmata archaeon]